MNINQDIIELKDDLQSAIDLKFRVVQIDECMITKKSLPTLSWSKLRQNALIDYTHFDCKSYAIIGAVSREMGMEHMMVFHKSLNTDRFLVFLE